MHNPLKKLQSLGQSIWLDYLKRQLIRSGQLQQLIDGDGLSGVTSNPDIFDKAISEGEDYSQSIQTYLKEGKKPHEIYEALTVKDIQDTAELFYPVYESSGGNDGFVSLEVNPHFGKDTSATIEEARRLWRKVNRPNAFIKVPGTVEGLPAIKQLISDGININITLLFGLPRYRKVAEAYIEGLESRLSQGKPIDQIASVASFFLSRIDVMIDPLLEKIITQNNKDRALAKKLQGQVAIASAKLAYQDFKSIFYNDRFNRLVKQGARIQRLLWASTGTKNPEYSDIKYIEPLIGQHTINTLPLKTLEAYRTHGHPELRLEQNLDEAILIFEQLPELNIDIDKITMQLEEEGLNKFIKPYDHTMETLQQAQNKRMAR